MSLATSVEKASFQFPQSKLNLYKKKSQTKSHFLNLQDNHGSEAEGVKHLFALHFLEPFEHLSILLILKKYQVIIPSCQKSLMIIKICSQLGPKKYTLVLPEA